LHQKRRREGGEASGKGDGMSRFGGDGSAEVFLFRRPGVDWSNSERAEIHGVLRFLIEAGQPAELDEGVSDEGDPWCAFCDAETGDVKIHVARIDSVYVVHAAMLREPITGRSIRQCAERFFDAASRGAAAVRTGGPNVYLHPASLMMALFIAMFVQSRIQDDAYPASTSKAPGERPGGTADAGGDAATDPAADAAADAGADAQTGTEPSATGWMRSIAQHVAEHLEAMLRNRSGEGAAQGVAQTAAHAVALASAAALAAALIETYRASEMLVLADVDRPTAARGGAGDGDAARDGAGDGDAARDGADAIAAAMAATAAAAAAQAVSRDDAAQDQTKAAAEESADPDSPASGGGADIRAVAGAARMAAAADDAAPDAGAYFALPGALEPGAPHALVETASAPATPAAPGGASDDAARTLAEGGVETIATLVASGLKPERLSDAWAALDFLLAARPFAPSPEVSAAPGAEAAAEFGAEFEAESGVESSAASADAASGVAGDMLGEAVAFIPVPARFETETTTTATPLLQEAVPPAPPSLDFGSLESAPPFPDDAKVDADAKSLSFIALFMARVDAFELRASGDDLHLIDTDLVLGVERGPQFTRSVDFDDGSVVVLSGFFADFGWGVDLSEFI